MSADWFWRLWTLGFFVAALVIPHYGMDGRAAALPAMIGVVAMVFRFLAKEVAR